MLIQPLCESTTATTTPTVRDALSCSAAGRPVVAWFRTWMQLFAASSAFVSSSILREPWGQPKTAVPFLFPGIAELGSSDAYRSKFERNVIWRQGRRREGAIRW